MSSKDTTESSKEIEEEDDELPMPPIFRTESEMLKYALKLSLESAAESTAKNLITEENENSNDEDSTPSLTRTVSALPPPPTTNTLSSSYSMKKTESEIKEEDHTSGKVFSFYRSQSIAPQDAATDNTSVFVWGQNDSVMLPLFADDDHHRSSPNFVHSLSSLKLVDLELCQDRLLGITHEGSIIGMGNNDTCQILNDDIDTLRIPRVVNVAVESGAHSISCGSTHSALVTRDGEVFTWGDGNSKGSTLQLKQRAWKVCCNNNESSKTLIVLTEDGDVLFSEHEVWASNPEPLRLMSGLSSLPVVWISSGKSHVVAVTQEGLAFGWGSPYFGVRTSFSKEPIQINHLDKILFAACGDTHTCFVDTSRRVLTAGKNNRGQLGRENGNEITPMPVNFDIDVDTMRVSCGSNHTLCLCKSRSEKSMYVFGWGCNRYGQIGLADSKSSMVLRPKRIKSDAFQKMRIFNVVAGGNRSCAIAISPGSSSHAFKINSGSTLRTLATETRLSESLISSVEAFEIGKTGSTRKMLKLAKRAFGSLTSLNVCFVSATDRVGDMTDNITVDTKSMFEFLNRFPRHLTDRLVKIVESCVDNFQSVCLELKRTEQLRSVLCLLLVCGSLRNVRLEYHHLLDRVLSSLSSLPNMLNRVRASSVLARMAIEIVDAKSLSDRLVRPLVRAFDVYFRQPKTEQNVRRWVACADFLNDLYFHNSQNKSRTIKAEYICHHGLVECISNESFVSRVASGLPDRALYEEYQRWLSRQQNNGVFSMMKYSFFLDAASKRRVLQLEARFGMIQRGRNAIFQSMFRRTSPYFVLSVRREAILRDTLNRINQILREQLQQEMKKELKVVFANEEGIDQGGVKREFFQLLVEELFNPLYGMWIRNKTSGSYWFAAHNELISNSDDLNNYFLTGIALGLCVYNGVLLDINFPKILYKKLLGEKIGLPDLKDLMPSEYDGLMKLLQYEKDDVEDVFCLNFEVTVKDFGTVTTHELIKCGSEKEVTLKNKCEYVDLVCDFYLNKRVDAQFRAFARGFATLVDGKSFEFFTSSELDLLVAGETELDFKAMEQATLYEGGYSHGHPVIRRLWTVLHGMTQKDRAKFLKFVTGCPRAPIGGLGKLSPPLKIQKHGGRDETMLPQAATCFSTLLLPEYSSIQKLREKLLLAIENCEGFGLK